MSIAEPLNKQNIAQINKIMQIIQEYDLQSIISIKSGSEGGWIHLFEVSEMDKFDNVVKLDNSEIYSAFEVMIGDIKVFALVEKEKTA